MTKILVDKAVIEQALEALNNSDASQYRQGNVAIDSLVAALEQPQVEQNLEILSPKIPLKANLNALARNPKQSIRDFGYGWASRVAASALLELESKSHNQE